MAVTQGSFSNPIEQVRRFELLEHPADIGFRAHGRAIPELFAVCAEALLSIILDASEAQDREAWQVSVQGSDLESLLVNWLNEVLCYVDAKRVIFTRTEIRIQGDQLNATCRGEARDFARHPSRVLVKAVTYHQLRIFESEGGWTAEVYVDV